ncbi:3188_t:CDS:2 [Dentiscutata erythropus]|uniref:3188_t:CDS:1 n=1 Tax=Dentiscutata erythropus TaxID=1348616 RepID=A0A9N9JIK8_9GLOM|nr:3188_t:CDS:2 [Dentiscutata erythropus]
MHGNCPTLYHTHQHQTSHSELPSWTRAAVGNYQQTMFTNLPIKATSQGTASD